jgi:hypothetical protein
MNIDNNINEIVKKIISELQSQIKADVIDIVQKQIVDQVARIDITSLFNASFTAALADQKLKFPVNSIPGKSIDTTDWEISGDNINSGIIKNFGSTGIDDKATKCQVSIFDNVTVVENNLLTKDLTVKGTVTVEGDLNITGTIPDDSTFYNGIVARTTNNIRASLDQFLFKSYADMVTEQIKSSGLDLNTITINGRDAISGSNLGSFITTSNLQRVGQLQELQVSGETFLSETLYTTKKRVGINTIEPGHALSVWDQEIELGIGKHSNNTAVIGTPRKQTLVLSSNGKNNLTLNTDGGVKVDQISIGAVTISSGSTPPGNDQPKGTVVFNSNPSMGGPLGWVSLGNATWANFGIID